MSKVKMIAFDLDGTLLTTDKKITEYTREVLDQAIQKGIEVVPSTGRPLKGVPQEFSHYKGIHYIVTSNGARVVETEHQKTLRSSLLSYESAKKVLDIFREYDTIRDVFYDGQGYMERKKFEEANRYVTSPSMIEYMRTSRIRVEDIDEMFERENRPVDKIQALFASQEEKMEAFERILGLRGIEASGALANNIEVNAEGVHKGVALAWLGECLGIKPEEMLVFGDGSNDIGMIRMAGTGVAMDNAQPAVKEAADAITRSNDSDGVAKYIESYVLN